MSLHEYLVRVQHLKNNEESWRLGQTYFNVLYECRPDLANAIRGTSIDPFYVDELMPAFLSFVADRWPGN